MKTKEKREYIESVRARIQDAKNHGSSGNSWWYPTPWTVAYNIKIHANGKDIDDMRAKMTRIQNKYYSDETLYNIADSVREQACEDLRNDILSLDGINEVSFAGRSGGWIEVTYRAVPDADGDTEQYDTETLEQVYRDILKLDNTEQTVADIVKQAVAGYIKYIKSNDYVDYVIESLASDRDIITEKKSILASYTSLA